MKCTTSVASMMLLAVLSGCGDDATTDEADEGKDTTGAGGEKDAGTKDAGSEDEDAGKGDGKVRCGDQVCAASPLAAACCTVQGAGVAGDPNELTGRAPDLCGADLSAFVPGDAYICAQTNQPGVLDSACPVTPSPGGDLMGCCSDEGFCGGMETGIPLGCVYGEGGRGAPCGQ